MFLIYLNQKHFIILFQKYRYIKLMSDIKSVVTCNVLKITEANY